MFDTMIQVTISDPPPEGPLPMVETATPEPRTEAFELYKGVLTFYSDYFCASLNGDFEEAHNKHIHLSSEDLDFETFRMVRGWLYTRIVHHNGIDGEGLSYTIIIKLWAFADAYLVPMLKNVCIDLIEKKLGTLSQAPSNQDILLIYSLSSKSSSIRRLAVDMLPLFEDVLAWLREFSDGWPPEFFFGPCGGALDPVS